MPNKHPTDEPTRKTFFVVNVTTNDGELVADFTLLKSDLDKALQWLAEEIHDATEDYVRLNPKLEWSENMLD